MQINLKAARRRASRSGLILAKFVLYACAETAIFELPFKILLLDLATGFPIWCRYFGDRRIEERLACLDLDTRKCRRIKHDKIMHNLTLWPFSRYYNMSVHSRHTRLTECRSNFYIYSSLLSYCRLSKWFFIVVFHVWIIGQQPLLMLPLFWDNLKIHSHE